MFKLRSQSVLAWVLTIAVAFSAVGCGGGADTSDHSPGDGHNHADEDDPGHGEPGHQH